MAGPERIIAVGGGKGGVGKTLMAANLAVTIARSGRSVVCVDCDLGAANLHTNFGLVSVKRTLADFLYRRVSSLSDLLIPTGVPNLSIIPGSGAVPGAANIAHAQKLKLIRHLRTLDTDVVILDIGAGVAFNTIDLFCAADVGVVVCSPQLPSVQNVYSFLKSVVYRSIQLEAETPQERSLYKTLEEKDDTEGTAAFLQRIEAEAPDYAQRARARLGALRNYLVGNLCFNERECNTFYAVSRMMMDFLLVDVPFLAALSSSKRIHNSVNKRTPYLLSGSSDANSGRLQQIGRQLMQVSLQPTNDATASCGKATEAHSLHQAVTVNTRQAERFPVQMKATIVTGQRVLSALVEEISTHGMLIRVQDSLEVQEQVELLLDAAPSETLRAKVVRQTPPDTYGVELHLYSRLDADVVADYAERFAPLTNSNNSAAA